MFSQVQDIDLVLVKFHKVLVSPFLQPIQVFLEGHSSFQNVTFPTQFSIIGKLRQGTFDPIFQITYEDIESNTEQWETRPVACSQFEVELFTAILYVQFISQFPTHCTG